MMTDMKMILCLVSGLAVALPLSVDANEVTLETCKADYEAMVKSANENRERSIIELESALRLTSDDDAAGDISQQIDRTWEIEETFLQHASTFYRDCVKHVESGGS